MDSSVDRWQRSIARSTVAALLLCAGAAATAADDARRVERNGFDIGNASIPIEAIERGGPPKDGIPAIDKPIFVSASKASLRADDRILGVELRGQARAYPIRILNWHEVVNDRFGERSIIVSYCPLCGTGMVFETPMATAKAADSSFGVSGLLYNSDVLLYDRATQSLWSQIMQTAISGPLRGTRLKMLAATHTSWADWQARHPATVVLSTDTGFARDYRRDPYATYEAAPQLLFDVQHRDDRVALKEWVLGVEIGAQSKAYPLSVLARAVDANGEMRDRVGSQQLRIRYNAKHRSAEAFNENGTAIPTTLAYWFAWVAFHPQTAVLEAR